MAQRNDAGYVLARLERDNEPLAQAVIRGELSAHRAAVQAGIRKPSATFPLAPVAMAQAIGRRFDDGQIDDLIAALLAVKAGRERDAS
jgi:hypothetical protein